MILVEGGSFMMGSHSTEADRQNDEHQHQVSVSSFYMSRYQVTQAQWRAVMNTDPSYFKGDSLPVEQVSWEDIQVFLQKLNKKTKQKFRLPTEAEWEYAARGGQQSKGFIYAGSDKLEEVGYYDRNSTNQMHPVGRKKPNELGIYDMSGNVFEWCQDWYDNSYYKNSPDNNPTGPTSGTYRVLRGGSWSIFAQGCRVAARYNIAPNYRNSSIGFRLVCELKPKN